MNILLAVPWDQKQGGVASVVGNLAKHLESHGHKVVFLHPDRTAIFAREGKTRWGFRGYKLRLGIPFMAKNSFLGNLAQLALFPLTVTQLMLLVWRHRIQIVNIHYPAPTFAYLALCRLLLPIKLVSSLHGADIFPRGRPRSSYPAAFMWLLRRSDLIVANSAAFRNDFLQLFPEFRDKSSFIHNGVDLSTLATQKQKASLSDGRYLLCVAMHNEKKGLDVLLRAFAHLADSEPDLGLWLVGDGPLRRYLEELARTLGIDRRVRFWGRQAHADVARLLSGCEAFVLPSRSEPFGIAILEALACGKPVIASRVGGIPEIITDGENGVLVEPEDPSALAEAILAVIRNPCLKKKIVQNGRATVERCFCHGRNGVEYERAFETLMRLLDKSASNTLCEQ